MKINDVITEGLWDAVKGAVTGYTQSNAQRQGQDEINAQVKGMMPYWQKQVQALRIGGVDMDDKATYQQYFQDWMSDSGFPDKKDFSGLGNLASTEPVAVRNYLAKAVAMNMSGQAPKKPVPVPVPEAGVWDAVKGAAKGAAQGFKTGTGAIPTAVAGAKQAFQQGQGQADMNAEVKGMLPYWQQKVQALQSSGINMGDKATYQQYFQDWMTKEGFPGNKDFSQLGDLPSVDPIEIQKYLSKAVAMNRSGVAQAKAPAAAVAQPASPGIGGKFAKAKRTVRTQPTAAPAPAPAPATPAPAPAPTNTTPNWVTVGGRKVNLNDPANAGMAKTFSTQGVTLPAAAPAVPAAAPAVDKTTQAMADLEKTMSPPELSALADELMKKYKAQTTT
jgi:hypothetical protein